MASASNDPVDLTNCDREPIHIPGSIQPHGAMLVCDPETGKVLFASETAENLLGTRNSGLIGLSLAEILGANAAHDLRNAAMKVGGSHLAGVVMGLKVANLNLPVDAVMHQHRDRLFVEIEPTAIDAAAAQRCTRHDTKPASPHRARKHGRQNCFDRCATYPEHARL